MICIYQYGIILYYEQYLTDDDSEKYVTDTLSKMFLANTLMCAISIPFLGYILDRVKVWKFLLAFSAIEIVAIVCFLKFSHYEQQLASGDPGNIIQDISFVTIIYGLNM